MEQLVINGGRPLEGTVSVSGAKNAALPIMAATLLVEGPTVLHRVPRLSDVETMAEILRRLGMAVEWIGPNTLHLEAERRDCTTAPADLVRAMRASICVLGPLLATRGAACVPLPGGCVIGNRPIDLHIKALRAMGAGFRQEEDGIYAWASKGLAGVRLRMLGPHGTTVTGTANILMAAVLAHGRTVIDEAACEPEVEDLCRFLRACGARIEGIGSHSLTVKGVEHLRGREYTIIPDRIEAGTYLAAGVITGGRITVAGVRPKHIVATVRVMEAMGVRFDLDDDRLTAISEGPLRATKLDTAPYPGPPTDMQPQLSALLCLARGTSTVTEHVYPERFTHVPGLCAMGAAFEAADGVAAIAGVPILGGANVRATDLRAGAALVLAGLAAPGETVITGMDQIDRGYQKIEERLSRVGAYVRREHIGEERKSA